MGIQGQLVIASVRQVPPGTLLRLPNKSDDTSGTDSKTPWVCLTVASLIWRSRPFHRRSSRTGFRESIVEPVSFKSNSAFYFQWWFLLHCALCTSYLMNGSCLAIGTFTRKASLSSGPVSYHARFCINHSHEHHGTHPWQPIRDVLGCNFPLSGWPASKTYLAEPSRLDAHRVYMYLPRGKDVQSTRHGYSPPLSRICPSPHTTPMAQIQALAVAPPSTGTETVPNNWQPSGCPDLRPLEDLS